MRRLNALVSAVVGAAICAILSPVAAGILAQYIDLNGRFWLFLALFFLASGLVGAGVYFINAAYSRTFKRTERRGTHRGPVPSVDRRRGGD